MGVFDLNDKSPIQVEKIMGSNIYYIDNFYKKPESILKLCCVEDIKITQKNHEHTLWVNVDDKMTVLRALTAQPSLRDIEIKEASLQALYSHYPQVGLRQIHGESSIKELNHG